MVSLCLLLMNKKILVFLTFVTIVASVLRLWQLGEVPISPDWDEVALGYNAYSIMQTGRDEYGEFFPIVLRSFDDYKPALYAYLSIPSISIFGLNIFSVRLPSAIFGILTVFAVFFLVRELFKKNDIALLTSFLLAISPWHIQFSRIAFEANVGVSLNVLSVLFFIKGLKKPWFFIISSFLAGISIYIYQSEKVFIPLLFLALIIVFRKQLFSVPKKYIFTSLVVGLIVVMPMVIYIVGSKNSLERARGVSIFSQSNAILEFSSKRILEDKKYNSFLGLVIDNRRIAFAKQIVAGYLSHFDLNWLFIKGDIARHHAPNMGLIYLFELPFIFIGIYALCFGNFDKKTKIVIFTWFFIAPIPASITTGVPHAVRTINLLPTFQILSAIGIISVLRKISNFKFQIRYLIFSLCLLFFIFNFSYYLNQYFVQQNYFNADQWQYGYSHVVPVVEEIEKNYKKIIVSNQPPMDQSYMFFLFYLKYSPQSYQINSQNVSGGFMENHFFGKYEFRPIEWDKEEGQSDTLYVGRPLDFPINVSLKKEVFYPDGRSAMKVITKY